MHWFKHFVQTLLVMSIGVTLTSANMHLQTSADAESQQVALQLGRDKVSIFLDAPGVYFEKSARGHLTYITFFRMNTLVKIWFHPKSDMDTSEKIRLVKRFQLADGKWLLHGPTREFNSSGELLSETNWMDGKLHGKQLVYSPYQVLLEEKHWDLSFPIGTWKLFYSGGTLASEVTYPESKKKWLSTLIPGYDTLEPSLFSMDYQNSIPATEVWYTEEGLKQKEQQLICSFDGKRYRIEETGAVAFYDSYGQRVRHREVVNGKGRDTHDITTLGVRYRNAKEWQAGHLFKKESSAVPSHLSQ